MQDMKNPGNYPAQVVGPAVAQLHGPVYFLGHFCCLAWDVRGSQYVDKNADFAVSLGIRFLCLLLGSCANLGRLLKHSDRISLLVQQDNNEEERNQYH